MVWKTTPAITASGVTIGLSLHLLPGIHHRADYLVVAGATAKVASQPMAYPTLVSVGFLIKQRLGRDDDSRRADPTMEVCLF